MLLCKLLFICEAYSGRKGGETRGANLPCQAGCVRRTLLNLNSALPDRRMPYPANRNFAVTFLRMPYLENQLIHQLTLNWRRERKAQQV